MGPLAVALVAAMAVHSASAQREGYSYVSHAGPEVSLVSKASDDSFARVNTPVMAGDRIQTGSSSRAEVILADGNVLRIDGRTSLRFDRLAATYESDDERDLIALEKGSLSLETRGVAPREVSPRIDTDDATVTVSDRSVIRVDAGRRGTEIFVLSGRAEVSGRSGRAVVRSGESAYVSGEEPVETGTASFPRDRFGRFVDERRDRTAQPGASRNIPEEFAYDYDQGDLEEYGSWSYVSNLDATCWRPNVPAGWLPYSNGYWRWTPGGQTWVSYEPWGWLPFHFGSWSLDPALGWCWSPGRRYAPAWVYWNYSHGWVGWCPTGYYGQYGQYAQWGRDRLGKGGGYPHLAGRVDLASIDQRGWSFVASDRFGTRFDPKDVVRGDRVSFKPGQVGVIATAPLRVDRGAYPTMTAAVQESVRRVLTGNGGAALGDGRGTRGRGSELNQGLTEVLRREPNLSTAGRDELRHTWVRTGGNPGIHSVSAEAIAQGTRPSPAQVSSAQPLVRLDGGFRQSSGWQEGASSQSFPRGDGGRRLVATESASSRDTVVTPSASWREPAPGVPREVRREGGRSAESWRGAPPKSDDGWRSAAAPRSGTSRHLDTSAGTAPAPRHLEPSRPRGSGDGPGVRSQSPVPAPRSAPAPSHSAPAPSHKSR
jgi:hypothetical protein